MKFSNILNPKLYEEKDLNITQKWSKKVDEIKKQVVFQKWSATYSHLGERYK